MLNLTMVANWDVVLSIEGNKKNEIKFSGFNEIFYELTKKYFIRLVVLLNEKDEKINKNIRKGLKIISQDLQDYIKIEVMQELSTNLQQDKDTVFLEWHDYSIHHESSQIPTDRTIKIYRPLSISIKDLCFIKNNLSKILFCFIDIDDTLLERNLTFLFEDTVLNKSLTPILKAIQNNNKVFNYIITSRKSHVYQVTFQINKIMEIKKENNKSLEFDLQKYEISQNEFKEHIEKIFKENDALSPIKDIIESQINEQESNYHSSYHVFNKAQKSDIKIMIDNENSFSISQINDRKSKAERIHKIYIKNMVIKGINQKNEQQGHQIRISSNPYSHFQRDNTSEEKIGLFFDDQSPHIEYAKKYFEQHNLPIYAIKILSKEEANQFNLEVIRKEFRIEELANSVSLPKFSAI